MKMLQIEGTDLTVSNIILGCMRLNNLTKAQTEYHIKSAIDQGINFFDHADIYADGECEQLFAQAVLSTKGLREQIILQSKCGIIKEEHYYDLSKEHIIQSAENSLKRLHTDYLDVFLLHRPDTLMQPEEIAQAFEALKQSGKVRYFGVSNFNPMQIELLQSYLKDRLIINQLQLSLAHTPIFDTGLTANMKLEQSIMREGSILEYSRLHKITLQAWSPFQKGFFDGPFLGDTSHYSNLNEVIDQIAAYHQVSPTTIAVAFLTRHPANMQVIIGTTNEQHLLDSCMGSDLPLSRKEWYALYEAAGNKIP